MYKCVHNEDVCTCTYDMHIWVRVYVYTDMCMYMDVSDFVVGTYTAAFSNAFRLDAIAEVFG